MNVTKAIIPAAGFGTRFLPATKAIPKEMLPLLEKPAAQYIVEEALKSGIKNFTFVTSQHKKALEDHFDTLGDLDQYLESKGKVHALGNLPKLCEGASFTYVRQGEPRGLGHAIWMARHQIGNEPVAIMLPDDIILGPNPAMAQLLKVAAQERASVIAVQEVPLDQVPNYGVISIRKQLTPSLFHVRDLVEKPSMSDAPSNLAVVGRYVLSPKIAQALEEASPGSNGEIELTDAISKLALSGEKVYALKISGQRFDIGQPLGWLQANIAIALTHPQYGKAMQEYLAGLDREMAQVQQKLEAQAKQV